MHQPDVGLFFKDLDGIDSDNNLRALRCFVVKPICTSSQPVPFPPQ